MERDAVIVAGFGCRAGASPASLRAALDLALSGGPWAPAALAAPADRIALLAPLASTLGVPAIPVPDATLATIDTPTRSPAVLATRGVGSVAEAAALAACGADPILLTPRQISPDRMATCAIARGTP
jgi:cobalt-precorrin 5A hydrolase